MDPSERIASSQGADVNARDIVAGADAAPDTAMWLYALTTRLPMGQADRYAVLAAPTVAARVSALRDAVETVSALVEFQLSGLMDLYYSQKRRRLASVLGG